MATAVSQFAEISKVQILVFSAVVLSLMIWLALVNTYITVIKLNIAIVIWHMYIHVSGKVNITVIVNIEATYVLLALFL